MTIYKEHTRLSLIEGGNVFKQGDHVTLGFVPRDYAGNILDLTGKQIEGVVYSGRKGIMFQAPATFDSAAQKIVFTIDQVVDYGQFQIEFTATDASDPEYRLKLPSAEQDGRLTIKPSVDNMDFVGVQMTTVTQLRQEQTALQTEYEAKVDPKIAAVEQKVAEVQTGQGTFEQTVDGKIVELESTVQQGIGAFTEDTEVVMARGGEVNLGARLDKTAAQLAEKVGGTVKAKMEDLDDEVISAVTGGATVNVLSIPQDGSVTREKTTFATVGKNRFDKDKRVLDTYIYHVNGATQTNTSYDGSPYIPVVAGQTMTISKARNYTLYNESKTFVSGADGTGASMTFTPAQNGFVRFTMFKADVDTLQAELGSAVTAFEPYGTQIKNLSIPDNYLASSKLKDIARIDAYPFQALANFSANADGEKEIKNAVKKIEVIGADFTKKYCLGIIQRNFSTYGTGAYIYECDAAGATTKIVALTSKTSYTEPSGVDVFDLAPFQSSGISAKVYVDWSQITTGKQYTNTHYDKAGLDVRTYVKIPVNEEVKIVLPPKIPAIVGKEVNIYFDNIIMVGNINDYQIDVTCNIGKQQNERWTATPSAVGTNAFTLSLYKSGVLAATATSSIIVSAAAVGTGVTRKAVFIGDSTTDAGSYTGELVNGLFGNDPMNIELLGTRGTAPNRHEGRAGWRASDYVNSAIVSGVANAFYNNGFDFTYYMTQQGYTGVDTVFIHLGINDVFGFTDDATLQTEITAILSRFDTMLNSVKAYNANTKVSFMVTIPPSKNQDSFGNNYGNGQTRWRYFRNYVLFVEKLIAKYKGREAEGIYLVPVNVNLDTVNNMMTETVAVNSRNPQTIVRQSNGVHPAGIGYYQMSDVIYYWLKGQEV